MEKPRIVIADTDISYIIPLQQKFVEEYFEKINLEIISDQTYYDRLFSSPQKVDILIISEELYTPDIKKHNIGNIFLMTEHCTEKQIDETNVSRIYKYTSIIEIFDAIINKSFIYLQSPNIGTKETQIIVVYSSCGGVGKTTVAFGISACLNRNFKRVLYMNASHLQSFQTMLSNSNPIIATDVYANLTTGDNLYTKIKAAIRNEGFSYIPSFKAALMSLGMNYTIFKDIALLAKDSKDYDYIIIDTDTVLDEEKMQLIDIADKVIIVTKQNKSSVYATNVLVSNINGVNSEKYIFICNDFNKENENFLVSPSMINKFSVDDYIRHLSNYDYLQANDLANDNEFQKIAFLII